MNLYDSIMNLYDSICKLINKPRYKKLSVRELPSQGYFYYDDFSITIKKPDNSMVERYKESYENDTIIITHNIKKIVKNNIILSDGYIFDDIKSIDILYIFFKIVEFYKGNAIKVRYHNIENNEIDEILFEKSHFKYWELNDIDAEYDRENRCFIKYDYKYSLPTIGVENSMIGYLINRYVDENTFIDFLGFVGDKNRLSYNDIDNLIEIFNHDMNQEEKEKIQKLLEIYSPIQKYNLIKDDQIIDMKRGIDLHNIWD